MLRSKQGDDCFLLIKKKKIFAARRSGLFQRFGNRSHALSLYSVCIVTDIIINDIVKNILKLVEITVTAMIVTGVTSSTSTIHQRGTDPAPLPFTPVEGLGATFQDTPVDLRDNIGSSDIESLLCLGFHSCSCVSFTFSYYSTIDRTSVTKEFRR